MNFFDLCDLTQSVNKPTHLHCLILDLIFLMRHFHPTSLKSHWLTSLPPFLNKIKKIRDPFTPLGTENEVHPPSDPPKITVFRHVSEDAVDKIIKASLTKSCLLDPWPAFLIKECIDILLISYKAGHLMEGCIHDAFKTAVVTLFIKKANLPSDDLKNYCPVSGLSFISKLVEHVVANQLLEHIHVHNLDNQYQSAYKAGHSTETALLSLIIVKS